MRLLVPAVCLTCVLCLAAPVGAQSAPAAAPVAADVAKPAADKTPGEKPGATSGAAPVVNELRVQPAAQGPAPNIQGAQPRENPAPVESTFQFEIRYDVNGVDLQGNTARSFLNRGINHTGDTNYLYTRPVYGDRWKFEHLGAFRYTDNPRVDPERNSLQKTYFRLSGPSFEANAGDALVNYSRFSFNQNIKGFSGWKDFTKSFRVYGNAGYFVDRWGSLYRGFDAFRNVAVDCQNDSIPGNPLGPIPSQPASGCVETAPFSGTFVLDPTNPNKPYSRLVGGARGEYKLGRNGWLAVNWSHGDDQLQSLPLAKVQCVDALGATRVVNFYPGCNLPGETVVAKSGRPGPESVLNDVLTVDASYEVTRWRLRVAGEMAQSWTAGGQPPAGASPTNFICASTSPVFGASVLDSRCFSNRVGDQAYRFEANQRLKKLNWRMDFSRFEGDFLSSNARQIRDLQDFSARADYEIIRQITVVGSFRRTTDNVDGRRAFTNIVRAPEIRLIFREIPGIKRATLEAGYRERNLDIDGTPTTPNDNRKRSTRIPFVSLSLPFQDTILSFDYEHRRDSDAVRPPLSSDTDRFALGLRGNFTISNWDVSPSVRFELERLAKNSPNDPTRSATDPALLFPADFFLAHDTNRAVQASLLIEAPKYWRFEGMFREFNSVTLSPVDPVDPLISLLYLNQGFKRPNWRASLTYKIRNDENMTITGYFERTNNFFATGDPLLRDLRSFRETVIGATLLYRFRR